MDPQNHETNKGRGLFRATVSGVICYTAVVAGACSQTALRTSVPVVDIVLIEGTFIFSW